MSIEKQIRDIILENWLFSPRSDAPFDGYDLKKEARLEEVVYLPPRFGDIVGGFSRPESCAVFAERGFGKSTYVELIRRRLERHNPHFPCVIWRPQDFEVRYKHRDIETLELIDHVECLAGLLLDCIQANILDHVRNLKKIRISKLYCDLYKTYSLPYASLEQSNNFRHTIPFLIRIFDSLFKRGIAMRIVNYATRIIHGTGDSIISGQDNREMLHSIINKIDQILISLDIEHVYYLMDGLDETSITRKGTMQDINNAISKFIAPIIMNKSLMDHDRLHIKFFLPDGIKDILIKEYGYRPRIKSAAFNVHWRAEDIAIMLKNRLLTYSDGRRSSLNELAEINLDELLVDNAKLGMYYSPRLYALLGKCILDEHIDAAIDYVRENEPPNLQEELSQRFYNISKDTIQKGIRAFAESKQSEHHYNDCQ